MPPGGPRGGAPVPRRRPQGRSLSAGAGGLVKAPRRWPGKRPTAPSPEPGSIEVLFHGPEAAPLGDVGSPNLSLLMVSRITPAVDDRRPTRNPHSGLPAWAPATLHRSAQMRQRTKLVVPVIAALLLAACGGGGGSGSGGSSGAAASGTPV